MRSGTVAGDGVLGNILLDEAPPAVASTVPAASGVAVPKNQVVRIVFTEPILPGTVTAQNVVLQGPSGSVAYALNITDGDTVATLTPLAPLKDETRYTVRIDKVKDRVGKAMAARFTSTFTTVDITVPTFVSLSPAVNGSASRSSSPVRIQFSEPIDPAEFHAPAFTLTGPQARSRGGSTTSSANTVLVFTPNLPLAEASAYRVQMSAAVDAVGNSQPQDLDYVFTTTDRTPPQILGLVAANNGAVIENTTASVTANVGARTTSREVDWSINDVFPAGARYHSVLQLRRVPCSRRTRQPDQGVGHCDRYLRQSKDVSSQHADRRDHRPAAGRRHRGPAGGRRRATAIGLSSTFRQATTSA